METITQVSHWEIPADFSEFSLKQPMTNQSTEKKSQKKRKDPGGIIRVKLSSAANPSKLGSNRSPNQETNSKLREKESTEANHTRCYIYDENPRKQTRKSCEETKTNN